MKSTSVLLSYERSIFILNRMLVRFESIVVNTLIVQGRLRYDGHRPHAGGRNGRYGSESIGHLVDVGDQYRRLFLGNEVTAAWYLDRL